MTACLGSWGGTLDMYTATLIWDLTIIVVQLGASTVSIGKGKRIMWLELNKDQFSCLKCEDSTDFKFKRKLPMKTAYLLAPSSDSVGFVSLRPCAKERDAPMTPAPEDTSAEKRLAADQLADAKKAKQKADDSLKGGTAFFRIFGFFSVVHRW